MYPANLEFIPAESREEVLHLVRAIAAKNPVAGLRAQEIIRGTRSRAGHITDLLERLEIFHDRTTPINRHSETRSDLISALLEEKGDNLRIF